MLGGFDDYAFGFKHFFSVGFLDFIFLFFAFVSV